MGRSVLVTGGPGTGKTRLAMLWATRAVVRGERTLLTCFNVPLAGEMRARLSGHELLTVDAFHEAMRSLPGMPPLEQPDDAVTGWWERELVDHVAAHLGEVAIRFDTVVATRRRTSTRCWLDLLDQLLDPDGPRRRLRVGDPSQLLYERGFTLPEADDGWTRCELAYNCRNTFDIAQLLRRHLASAATPIAGPPVVELCGVAAESLDHVVELVGEEIDRLDDADRRPDRRAGGHVPPCRARPAARRARLRRVGGRQPAGRRVRDRAPGEGPRVRPRHPGDRGSSPLDALLAVGVSLANQRPDRDRLQPWGDGWGWWRIELMPWSPTVSSMILSLMILL